MAYWEDVDEKKIQKFKNKKRRRENNNLKKKKAVKNQCCKENQYRKQEVLTFNFDLKFYHCRPTQKETGLVVPEM